MYFLFKNPNATSCPQNYIDNFGSILYYKKDQNGIKDESQLPTLYMNFKAIGTIVPKFYLNGTTYDWNIIRQSNTFTGIPLLKMDCVRFTQSSKSIKIYLQSFKITEPLNVRATHTMQYTQSINDALHDPRKALDMQNSIEELMKIAEENDNNQSNTSISVDDDYLQPGMQDNNNGQYNQNQGNPNNNNQQYNQNNNHNQGNFSNNQNPNGQYNQNQGNNNPNNHQNNNQMQRNNNQQRNNNPNNNQMQRNNYPNNNQQNMRNNQMQRNNQGPIQQQGVIPNGNSFLNNNPTNQQGNGGFGFPTDVYNQ